MEEEESREWYIGEEEGRRCVCMKKRERGGGGRGGTGGRGGAVPVSSLLEKWRVSATWLVWQLLQERS